jgi:hypothetical protein
MMFNGKNANYALWIVTVIMDNTPPPKSRPLFVIGWHECISLPDLGLQNFAVKIDTGAKTTALHAENIEVFTKDKTPWVRFQLPVIDDALPRSCTVPIFTKRDIRNTGGIPENRIIIQTPMVIAGLRWVIDISLTDRGKMRFPLILGRRALREHNIAVRPDRSYLVSERPTLQPKERGR